MNKKIAAIIPAKKDSNRLKNKNMAITCGKPLISYSINAAKECGLINLIYVSTDSTEIAEFAKKEGLKVIMRPPELTGEAPIADVYRHALLNMNEKDIDIVVGIQPDHPDRRVDLTDVIEDFIKKDLDDLISVGSDGVKNGSVRIMKADALRDKRISVKAGSIMDNATNIHTLKDLRFAEMNIKDCISPLSVTIGNKTISNKSRTFVIAEGACNHMCDISIAKKMIDEAEAAGADAIKFQTYKAQRLVSKEAKTYWNYGTTKSQYEYYKKLDKFEADEYKELFEYSKNKDIVVFSSPFDTDSADMLNELNMPLFKIASCLIPDTKLIRHIAKFKKPIILSTGGSYLDEIKEAVDAIYDEGNYQLILMACTLSYPAENKDANMLRIRKLGEIFPTAILGYSDHTPPDENMVIPSIAVGLRAKVIEKHFTLDRSMTGSGHSFSVDPNSLKKMIENIRLAEDVLGDDRLEVKESEVKTRQSARLSIVSACPIKNGEVITESMITTRRPGTGILPKFAHKILGRKAKRDIPSEDQIKWEDLS